MPIRGLFDGRLKFDSVLFATDFAPGSYPASLYAQGMATHLACPLAVLHVFLPNPNARGGITQQRSSLEELLALAVDALAPRAGGGTSLLLEGHAAEVIPRQANQAGNALLLLGIHGRNTVAEEVLNRVAVPTLTVGAHIPEVHKRLTIQRILYAADCSPLSVQTAAFTSAFATSFHSRMEVVDESQGKISSVPAQEAILRRLHAGDCHLLVLGAEPASVLRLIAEAPCPVLTIPGASVQ
jgi:nucleotide-binding universal stress UspA family protein